MTKQFYILFLCQLPAFWGMAQSDSAIFNDFKQINEVFENNPYWEADIEYTLIDREAPDYTHDQKIIEVHKEGNNTYQKFITTESIIENGIALVADHNNKTILVSKHFDRQAEAQKNWTNTFKQLLEAGISPTQTTSNNGASSVYTFTVSNSEFSSIQIQFKKSNYQLEEIIFHYAQPLIIQISYTNQKELATPELHLVFKNFHINTSKALTKAHIGKFVTKKGNEFELLKDYENYQLINKWKLEEHIANLQNND